MEMKVRPSTDVAAQPSEKKKLRYAYRLFGKKSLKEGATWRIDLFMGRDLKTNNEYSRCYVVGK
jgi:hypothetical protein